MALSHCSYRSDPIFPNLPVLTIMGGRSAPVWSELLSLGELMRDEPGRRCRIYRLYFNEENPSGIALRRWFWSLPSCTRGHVIKNISKKQLTDWGRMKCRRAIFLVRQIQRWVSPRTLAAPEPAKPIGTTDQIQSMIDRAFPRRPPHHRCYACRQIGPCRSVGSMHSEQSPEAKLGDDISPGVQPYPWGIRDMLDKIGICIDRNAVPK